MTAGIDLELADFARADALIAYANERDLYLNDAIAELVNAALKPRPTIGEYATALVRITRDAVFIGGERLPGCIAEGGVVLNPGGATDMNRLTVTFFVGEVTADDPYVTSAPEPLPPVPDQAYRFSSRQPAEAGE